MRSNAVPAESVPTVDQSTDIEHRVAGVAHELRTPLNGLLALADRLLTTPLADEQRQYVHAMRAAAHHLHAVATDVLDVAKLRAGKMTLTVQDIDLKALLEDIAALVRARASAKAVAFAMDIAAEVPHRMSGDGIRLRQMIENLADNAMKMTDSGCVTIKVGTKPASSQGAFMLTVQIEDTGAGFALSETENIFAPFAQGTNARGGAGLGLSLVRGYAEAMGGDVFARNRSEGGAVVGFTIKAGTVVPKNVPPLKPHQPRRDKSLSILVAEDNPINRVVIGTILDQFGHCHDLVATGAAAVAAVRQGNYDLVLMDKQMPELDGLSATRAIRTLSGKKAMTPIIGVTAGAFSHEIEEFQNAGAEAVVTKPVSVRALWQAIDEAFANKLQAD